MLLFCQMSSLSCNNVHALCPVSTALCTVSQSAGGRKILKMEQTHPLHSPGNFICWIYLKNGFERACCLQYCIPCCCMENMILSSCCNRQQALSWLFVDKKNKQKNEECCCLFVNCTNYPNLLFPTSQPYPPSQKTALSKSRFFKTKDYMLWLP